MDLRQTKEYGSYLRQVGWEVQGIDGVQVFVRKILGLGVMKIQRFDKELNWGGIEKLKKKHRVVYSVLEPLLRSSSFAEQVRKRRYKLSKGPYLPTKTLVVDLKKSEKKLWSELSKDARYQVGKADRAEVEVISLETEAMEEFWREWKKCRRGHVPSLKSLKTLLVSFGSKTSVGVAVLERKMVAGVIALYSDDTAFYYYAWTSKKGRELGAQYKLVWESILRAKNEGLQKWDFEGVEDGRWPRKSWRGFSGFKKKFGGKEVLFAGCFVRWW